MTPGREPLGPLEGPHVAEPRELGEEAGDQTEQDSGAALVHEPAADDEERDPQDARVTRYVQRDAEQQLGEDAQRGHQREQQQVAQRERPDVGRPAFAGHRAASQWASMETTSLTHSAWYRSGPQTLAVPRSAKSSWTSCRT